MRLNRLYFCQSHSLLGVIYNVNGKYNINYVGLYICQCSKHFRKCKCFAKRLPVHAAYRRCALKADRIEHFPQNMFLFLKQTLALVASTSMSVVEEKLMKIIREDRPQLSPVWDHFLSRGLSHTELARRKRGRPCQATIGGALCHTKSLALGFQF